MSSLVSLLLPPGCGASVVLATLQSAHVAAACAALCWALQVTTGYWSWVDRLWSLVPAAYAFIFAAHHLESERVFVMAVLAGLWALRLTANFARKGGYGAEEDYRWEILRAWFARHDPTHPLGREAFSLLFVALYQHVLLWLIVAPAAAAAAAAGGGALTATDVGLAAAFLLLLLGETITDEQQWAFQSAKHALTPAARARAGGDIARGFCTSGAFALSRHLNFFCEQGMWWVWYAFALSAGGPRLSAPLLGPALLSMLFLGSTTMTEAVTRAKYPAYAAYQRTTSRLLPWLPGVQLDSAEGRKLVEEATRA